MSASAREEKLVQHAIRHFQLGHAQGALAKCAELRRLNRRTRKLDQIAWVASAYLADCVVSEKSLLDARETAVLLDGGQGLAELGVLHLRRGDDAAALHLLDATLSTAGRQHGVLVTWQPTSVLARIIHEEE